MNSETGLKCLDLRIGNVLSEVSVEAHETVKLTKDLPTRSIIYNEVNKFINIILENRAKSSNILWIVGDWGQGKSAVYKGIISRREDVCSAAVTASQIASAMEAISEKAWDPLLFLTGLAKALSEKYGVEIEDFTTQKLSASKAGVYILKIYKDLCRDERPFLIFIDEFEDLVERAVAEERYARRSIVDIILNALVELKNGDVSQLNKLGLESKIHFAIAVTKAAESRLRTMKRSGEVFGIGVVAGRFVRRVYRIDIEDMLGIEALIHAQRLLSYVFKKDVRLRDLAEPPTLTNFITISSLGMPAAVERMVNRLVLELRQKGSAECGSRLRKLTVDVGEEVLSSIETVLGEGETQNVFMIDNFHKYRFDCQQRLDSYVGKRGGRFTDLCTAMLLSRGGISEEYVVRGFFNGNRELASRAISVLEITGIVKRLDAYRISPEGLNLKKIVETLNITIRNEGKDGRFASIISLLNNIMNTSNTHKSLGMGFTALSTFIDPLVYVGDSGDILIVLPDSDDLIESIYGRNLKLEFYLSQDILNFLKTMLESLEQNGLVEKYPSKVLIVNPEIQAEIFFSKEVAALKFIDKNARASYWARARKERDSRYAALALTLPLGLLVNSYFNNNAEMRASLTRVEGDEGFANLEIRAEPSGEAYRRTGDGSVKFGLGGTYYGFKPELRVDALVLSAQVRPSSIESYANSLRARKPWENPHIILLFEVGEIPEASVKNLLNVAEGLGIPVVDIRVPTFEYLRLTALGLALEESRGTSPNVLLESVLKHIFVREGGVPPNLKDILPEQLRDYVTDIARTLGIDDENVLSEHLTSAGVLLRAPPRRPTVMAESGAEVTLNAGSLRDAAAALKWVGNYYFAKGLAVAGREFSLSNVYRTVTDSVRRHTIFGLNYSFIGLDVESPKKLLDLLAPFISNEFKLFNVVRLREVEGRVDPDGTVLEFDIGGNPYFIRLAKIFRAVRGRAVSLEELLKAFTVRNLGDASYAIETFLEVFSNLAVLDITSPPKGKGRKSRRVLSEITVEWRLHEGKIREEVERLSKYLKSVKERGEAIEKLGYIVSGKQKGYSASYTPAVIRMLEESLKEAELYASPPSSYGSIRTEAVLPLMKLKYATAFLEEVILEHDDVRKYFTSNTEFNKLFKAVCRTHLGIVSASEYYIGKVIKEIESNAEQLRNKWVKLLAFLEEVLKEEDVKRLTEIVLEGSGDSSARLKTEYYKVLRSLKENIVKEVNRVVPEEEFYSEVSRLWEDVVGRGRDPASFPFYFKGQGPCYLFNYKVYLVKRAIYRARIGDVTLARDVDIPLCPHQKNSLTYSQKSELGRIYDDIEDIITRIRECKKRSEMLRMEFRRLLNKLRASRAFREILGDDFIGRLPQEAIAMGVVSISQAVPAASRGLSSNDRVLLNTIGEVVDFWIRRFGRDQERLRSTINGLIEQIERIDKFYDTLVAVRAAVSALHSVLSQYSATLGKYGIQVGQLEHLLERLDGLVENLRSAILSEIGREGTLTIDSIERAVNVFSRSKQRYESVVQDVDDESCREVKKVLNEISGMLKEYLRGLRNLMKPLSKIAEHVEELRSVAAEAAAHLKNVRNAVTNTEAYLSGVASVISLDLSRLGSILKQAVEVLSASEEKYGLQVLRRKMLEAIDKLSLQEPEKVVLKTVLDLMIKRGDVEGRLSISELVSLLEGRIGREDIGRALVSLISKEYLNGFIEM